MLLLRPNCECCDLELPPDCENVRICSFECTYCSDCASNFSNKCPNCGGELIRRPIRPAIHLDKFPASRKRLINPKHFKQRNYGLHSKPKAKAN